MTIAGREPFAPRDLAEQRRWATAFKALSAAGVARVTVTYDGADDEGGAESLDAVDAAGDAVDIAALPSALRAGKGPGWPDTLAADCEDLLNTALFRQHAGWADDAGASGTFEIDIATRAMAPSHAPKPPTPDDGG